MRDKMAEDNQDSKLKLSGLEEELLDCIKNLETENVSILLVQGANPHYEEESGNDAFDVIHALQKYPNHEVREIGNQMSEILLEHELTKSNKYFEETPCFEKLTTKQVEKQVQLHSPRSVGAIPPQESHLEKYLNAPMKRLSI